MSGKANPTMNEKITKKQKLSPDDDGFITPSPRTRKQRNNEAQKNKFLSQNVYKSLSDSEMSIEEILQDQIESSPRRHKAPSVIKTTSIKAAKPIIVTNTTFEVLYKAILDENPTVMPTIQKRRGNVFAVMAGNIIDKKKIVELLKTQKQQHYTFTEAQDRHLQFVLLGHFEIPVEELIAKLTANKIPATKISKINRSTDDPIYLVSFEKNMITLSDLSYNHNSIDGLRIRWDKFKPSKKRPTQCRRCQRFGHAANNCNLDYRCVKCLNTHEPGACSRTSREEGQPSCVNCQQEGHASNSTICPAFIKHTENINAKKKPPKHQAREFAATRFDWNSQKPSQIYNTQDFHIPLVASQHPASTSQPPPTVHRNNREYRPPLNHLVNRSLPNEQDSFSRYIHLQNEFMSLPDMNETLDLYALLLEELKNANSHTERHSVLLKHATRNSRPFRTSQ